MPVGILPFLHPVVPNLAKRSSEVRNQDLEVLIRKSEQLLSEWSGGPEDFQSHVFPRCDRNSIFRRPRFPRYLQTVFDFCSFPLSYQKTLTWPWLPQETRHLCTNYREESCLLPRFIPRSGGMVWQGEQELDFRPQPCLCLGACGQCTPGVALLAVDIAFELESPKFKC